MAKISPGYQNEMDSTKDLLINRAIKILIDVGMLKVTTTIYCIANLIISLYFSLTRFVQCISVCRSLYLTNY